METLKNYMAGHQIEWTGRIDDANDEDSMRWHQKMLSLDLNSEPTKPEPGFCFLGFCSDVGVKRNLGRPGTAKGPASIRGELANLPYGFTARPNLYDAGNIYPEGDDLETAQMQLAKAVKKIKQLGLFPIVLGGGHEVSHGHYQGLKDHFGRHLGIMNMDAHFDLRPYKNGSSSGTMFRQIADECVRDNAVFEYFPIGIQTYANTPALFKTAKALNCDYILAKDINEAVLADIYERLDDFINRQRHIYLTFDTDVVSSAYAPGVSAPQPFGLNPEISLKIVKHILKSNKVAAFDFVEVSPRFDDDHQTAKLVAVMIYAMINTLS